MISLETIDQFLLGSMEDINAFLVFCFEDQNLSFNPDTPFNDYVRQGSDIPIYTEEQANILDEIVETCYAICKQNGKDFEEICCDTMYDYLYRFSDKGHALEEGIRGVNPKTIITSKDGNTITGYDKNDNIVFTINYYAERSEWKLKFIYSA